MANIKKVSNSSLRLSTPKKKKIFIEALKKSHGVIQPALDTAQIVRGTYQNWLKADDKFNVAVKEAGEAAIDFVESQLYKNIHNGKEISTIFYLKTRAKHRGYVEASQLDITSGGEKVTFQFGGGDVTNVNNPDIKITDVNGESDTGD